MFDFGFSELMLIGAIALVVLGPEKLPIVARTAGEWIGKAQRMVQQVKNDIEREAELSELKKIQEEAKSMADDLTKTVKGQADEIQDSVKALEKDVNSAAEEMTTAFDSAKAEVQEDSFKAAEATEKVDDAYSGNDPTNDFYDWYGQPEPVEEGIDTPKTTFDKRYKSGPSIDELAAEIERLKAELRDRSPQLGGSNRRLVARARTNRVRIYR